MSCVERAYPDFLLRSPRNDQVWNSLLRAPHAIQRCNQKEIRGSEAEDSAALSHWDQIGG